MSVDHTRCQAALGHHPDTDPAGWTWTTLGPTDPGGDGRLLVDPAPEVKLGRQDETSSTSPTTAHFSLRNPDGLLSPGDRRSAWWPDWGEGTPVRLQRRIGATWHTRFIGEIAGIKARHDVVSGLDVVDITAASAARRQEQGEPPLNSPLRRLATQSVNRPYLLAYWPCEDGRDSQRAASPLAGVAPMVIGDPDAFGGADDHPGSDRLLSFSARRGGGWNGTIPDGPEVSHWRIDWMQRLGADFGESTLTWFPLMVVGASGGRVRRWQIMVDPTPQVSVAAWDGDRDGVVLENAPLWADIPGRWMLWSLDLLHGPDVLSATWSLVLVYMDGPDAGTGATVLSGTIFDNQVSRPTTIQNVWSEAPDGGLDIGQFIVSTQTTTGWLAPADRGWLGESARSRWARLLGEEDVQAMVLGPTDQSPPMGRQPVTTLTDLLEDCAAVGGISTELPDDTGRLFRTNQGLHNQATWTLPASAVETPLEPSQDDLGRANEVTAQRPDGATVTLADREHQDGDGTRPGRGRYATTLEANVVDDSQLPHHGSWRLVRGTWSEPRTPSLQLTLNDDTAATMWAGVVPGDRLVVPDGVAQGHHGPLDLIVEGWKEELGDLWTVTVNASPAGPWTAGVLDDGTGTVGSGRLRSSGTTVTIPVSDSATSIDVVTLSGPAWVDDTDHGDQFPLDVELGTGEVVTVTGCSQPVAAPDIPVARAADAFGRTETDGWGIADLGGPWQPYWLPDTDRSVSGGAGRVVLLDITDAQRSELIGPDLADQEILLSFSVDQVAAGADLFMWTLLRAVEHPSGNYVVGATLSPTGDVSLEVLDGGGTLATVASGVTYAADTVLWVRARVDEGHRIRGRIWPDTDPEPGTWLVDETAIAGGEIAAGQAGVSVFTGTDSTNTNPEFAVHSFEVVELVEGQAQTFTVTRSSNDVSKPIPVDATVQPAHPFRLPSPGSRVNARP